MTRRWLFFCEVGVSTGKASRREFLTYCAALTSGVAACSINGSDTPVQRHRAESCVRYRDEGPRAAGRRSRRRYGNELGSPFSSRFEEMIPRKRDRPAFRQIRSSRRVSQHRNYAENTLKSEFGKEIQVDLILKNSDNSTKIYKANIDKIDNHLPEKYTVEQVGKIVEKAVI
jgi:hypothetical protein